MSEMATGAPDLPTAVAQLRKRVHSLQRQIEEIRGPRGLRLPAWLKGYLAIGMVVLTWGAAQIFSMNREMGEVRTQLVSVENRLLSLEKTVSDGFARMEARLPANGPARK